MLLIWGQLKHWELNRERRSVEVPHGQCMKRLAEVTSSGLLMVTPATEMPPPSGWSLPHCPAPGSNQRQDSRARPAGRCKVGVEWGSHFFKLDSLNCMNPKKKRTHIVVRIWLRGKHGFSPLTHLLFTYVSEMAEGWNDDLGLFFNPIQFNKLMLSSCHEPVLSVVVDGEK